LLGEERLLAVWLLLCAMFATAALVFHLSAPPTAIPPGRVPAAAALAAALPNVSPHVRAQARPTAGPTMIAGPRIGSLPDSPPTPHPLPPVYAVPPLQPVNLVRATGRQLATSAQLLRQRGANLATLTVGYLPGTTMSPLRHRVAALAPVPTVVPPTPSTALPDAIPAQGITAGATPRIVYLVVTATPNPGTPYQQAGLRSALQPTAAAQPTATTQPTAVPPTDTPSFGNTQQVWITGYTDQGLTATGMQAGPGICAVDPSYIAMGTRIVIDGVGACLAEDTGSAVIGPHVDVWVPTDAEANAITGWHTASW